VTSREARGGTLVVGGGFAGGYVARYLGKRGATIVSLENFMLYTPMLPEAASGTLEPRHVVVPLRLMCPHAELIIGHAATHDHERGRVQVETEEELLELNYRDVVFALGATARTLPIPGLAEHGIGFKSLAEAIYLRNHVLRRLEAAEAAATETHRRRELTFVFIGAGYAGVEALAELSDLVRDALRHYPALREVPQRWVLVDAAPKILPEIPRGLGDYAARLLARRGIEIHVNTTLDAVEPTMRVEGFEHTWSLGDCARVPNRATSGEFDPPTCQNALRHARRLVKNLRKNERKPYRYRMLGQVATLGRYKGIAHVLGLHLRGFPGWFVTRTYHLYQLPLLSRKLRVVVDWTVSLFFRRDIAELGTLGHPQRLGDE
jgi:NADH:quinone reductase (non-electrogenic)